jgi:hypothetical protein
LEKAENIIENLSVVLAGLSVETREIIKKNLILAGQLEKAFLSLILPREEKATGVLNNEYIICRLIAP